MIARAGVSIAITIFFAAVLYTTNGCSGEDFSTAPNIPDHAGSLAGIVTNAVTNQPISGATVTVGSGQNALVSTTGANGRYLVVLIPVGSARVTVTANGYRQFSTTVTIAETANTLDVALQPN